MTYVCTQLIENVCQQWAEQSPLLPPLSYTEATMIGSAFWLLLAAVWGLKVIRVQIFEKN